jgi:putative intracellular protease/amidase
MSPANALPPDQNPTDRPTPKRSRARVRQAGRVAAKALIIFGAVVAVTAGGVVDSTGGVYPERDDEVLGDQAIPASAVEYDPSRPTAVVVLSPAGTNVADSLAPYEVLASTGAFNLYTVAEDEVPVPLTGGLDLVPDLTFDELNVLLDDATADVIVVPQLIDAAEPSADPIAAWLERQRADGDPLLMSVCVGAEVLAAAGMLDDRPATAHWLGLIGLRRNYTSVDWQDGVRYVEDRDIITTAGVLSGVDGALRVVERMVGADAAEQAAQAVQWPDYSPGEAALTEQPHLAPADTTALLSAGYRFDRPTMGVLLTEGVGEIELASAFRPYTELSYLAEPIALTADGEPIRSRHGLLFIPRGDVASAASELDRLVVPGAETASTGADLDLPDGLEPVYLHDGMSFAFDGALRDIAATYDATTARWVAKSMAYRAPTDLTGSAWPWSLMLRPILIALGAAAAIAIGVRLLRRRNTARPPVKDRFIALRGKPLRPFIRHYLEMLAAMIVGMMALGALESWLFAPLGWSGLQQDAEIMALTMATNMTIGMTAVMLWRRHSRLAIAEMAAVMYVSFAVFFPLLWFGALSASGLLLLGHVVMLFATAAVMLRRVDEYTGGHHHRHGPAPEQPETVEAV